MYREVMFDVWTVAQLSPVLGGKCISHLEQPNTTMLMCTPQNKLLKENHVHFAEKHPESSALDILLARDKV